MCKVNGKNILGSIIADGTIGAGSGIFSSHTLMAEAGDVSASKKHKEKLAKINKATKEQEDLNKRSEGYHVNSQQQKVPTKTQNTITTSPVTTGLNLGV